MKRTVFSLVLILITALYFPANAQNRIGIIGGMNLAKFELGVDIETSIFENTDVSNSSFLGFGAVLDFRLKNNLYLRFEPKYLKKGGDKTEEPPAPGFKAEFTYLELPVYLKLEFGTKNFKPYVITGPAIGFRLKTKAEFNFEGLNLKGDMKEVTKRNDLGFGFGGGFTYKIGNFDIFIQGCYTIGLKNIVKAGSFDIISGSITQPVNIDEGDSFKNKGLQIMAGLTMPFERK